MKKKKRPKVNQNWHIDKHSTGEAPSLGELRSSYFGYTQLKILPYTAIKADLTRQHYTMMPRTYYVDIEYTCKHCKKPFIFYANEQKYWYEDLGFFIESFPALCLPCRKDKRANIEARKFYDSQIKTVSAETPARVLRELLDAIDRQAKPDGSLPARMVQQRNRIVNLLGDAKLRA